MTIDDKYR